MRIDRLRRRDVIALLGGAAAAAGLLAPRVAQAQGERMRRVAIFRGGGEGDPLFETSLNVFRQELRKLGWVEGRNLRVDVRFGGGLDLDRTRAAATELVALAPDVIFATLHNAIEAIYAQTRTIPIVASGSGDLIAAGFAQSHARPGGNVTGFMQFEATINTKYLQLLKDMAPNVSRVLVMQTANSTWRGDFATIEAVAASLGTRPVPALVREAADIERAISNFAREPNGGLILPPDQATAGLRAVTIALAAKHRLPAIYSLREYVTDGGLMSYATDIAAIFRQAGGYVDRILRGAKPADLPVQAPTKFDLVINTKTAMALGIEVPLALLIRADELVE